MSEANWRRPSSVPHPSTWRRVVGRRPVNGAVPSFVVQDVPREREDDVLDFMQEQYLADEPVAKITALAEDRVSLDELRGTWRRMLAQRVSLVAFLEGDGPRPRIAAANMLGVVSRLDQNTHNFKGEAIRKITGMKRVLYAAAPDLFLEYGVQEYLSALGLSVARQYRGQGLGSELLRARVDLGRALGLRLSVTSFSSNEAQVLAAREGWQELSRVTYADFEVDGEPWFPNIEPLGAILMAKRLE